MEKFVGLWDLHWGYERRGGHKVALHDAKALSVAMQFIKDFRPDNVVLGGDILDCGAISHHQAKKAGQIEGLRIVQDARELRESVLDPLEKQIKGRLIYHIGNHEDWLNDVVDDLPGLSGIIDTESVLGLDKWEVVPNGDASRLGKLVFLHGDQVKGGENPAKWAVNAFNKNVFFGHHHTHQAFTKVSALDLNGHTGTAVPCLCRKNPRYGGGSPNRWMQGFLYGYYDRTSFNAFVVIIINGKAFINGREYVG